MAKKRVAKKEVKSKPTRKKEIPLGVKIISILGFIGAILLAIIGIFMIIGGIFILASHVVIPFPSEVPANVINLINTFLGPGLIVIGLIFLVFAAIGYFISMGLLRLKNWARIVVIVLSILGAVSSLSSILFGGFGQIVPFVIQAVIAIYLIFSEKVKKAFN